MSSAARKLDSIIKMILSLNFVFTYEIPSVTAFQKKCDDCYHTYFSPHFQNEHQHVHLDRVGHAHG